MIHLIIRRLRCKACRKVSHELPDMVIPYKRYESDAVAAVLEAPGDDRLCCPCESSTLLRWRLWFFLLHGHLEGAVRALMERYRIDAFVSLPLYPLDRQRDGWLKRLVRNLANAGAWPQTRSAWSHG